MSDDAEVLLAPWTGPYGGLPPFDKATPALIERAYETAVARKRGEVRAIASDPAPPTFENTVAALEDSGRELRRVECLFRVFSQTMSTPEMREVEQRLAPLLPALDDEIAHDAALFHRIRAVHQSGAAAGLAPEQQRLTRVVFDRLSRRGAALSPEAKARLSAINGQLAALQARFNQNLIAEQDVQAVFLEAEADLTGLGEEVRGLLAAAAEAKGREGGWAVPNARPLVWAFLTNSTRRGLRERVYRMWAQRGGNPGEHDNRPVIAKILKLRGEKARLLGYPTYAHFATADRMAATPEIAMALLRQVWDRVIGPSRAQFAELQAIADAEGAGIQIMPWDRLHYLEKLRRARFGLDADAIKPYTNLDAIVDAMCWAAGRLYGLEFVPLPDAPVCHSDVRVREVRRHGEPIGALWFDLLQRPGKTRGSWQFEYRAAESFRDRVLSLASVNSNVQPPAPGEPAPLAWEVANVFFHEFGHALHMLLSEARYPSLGSLQVAWDFVELPSLLNERWLLNRELLRRFAVNPKTGEPLPHDLIDKIEAAARFDRVTSLTVDLLAPAIVDMRVHLLADGRDVDAVAVEQAVLEELGVPEAADLILRIPHAFHVFAGEPYYAAGLYSYLWADVMAADVADVFERAPGGFYDRETAEKYRRTILSVGHSVPADEAFRNFRGRDPDPDALLRRFGLEGVTGGRRAG